jgi:hypothetical protein
LRVKRFWVIKFTTETFRTAFSSNKHPGAAERRSKLHLQLQKEEREKYMQCRAFASVWPESFIYTIRPYVIEQ